jgi:hypothetical protein
MGLNKELLKFKSLPLNNLILRELKLDRGINFLFLPRVSVFVITFIVLIISTPEYTTNK